MFAARILSAATGSAVTLLGVAALNQSKANAHCQVPCGIYDDDGRITQLREDATTVRKVGLLCVVCRVCRNFGGCTVGFESQV